MPAHSTGTPAWARLLGLALAAGWFYALPQLVKPHWLAFVDRLGGLPGVIVIGSAVVHVAMLLAGNLGFLALYCLQLPFFERYKTSPKPWPWLQGPQQRADIFSLVKLGIGLTLLNNLIAMVVAIGNVPVMRARGITTELKHWPSTLTLLWQTLFFIFVEDTLFYANHRFLHSTPTIYKAVHKLHHRWSHSLCIAAESTHWLEFIIGNAVPVIAGPLLLGNVHAYTLLQWIAFRVWETVDGHSGYDLPWQPFRLIPFAGAASDHDAHHAKNTGNFESFLSLWDNLLGTAIPTGGGGAAGDEGKAEAAKKKTKKGA